MANQVDFKILPSDQFNVYSPQTRSDKIITYFTLLSKLRGDILAVGGEDDPNDIVSAFYTNTGGTQTLHLVKADGSEITASQAQQVISGTLNFVSKFTSSNDIGDSQIFDNGTNVGIGTTSMTHKLQLGTGGVFADYFQLDTTYSNGFVVGAISWDSGNGTADIGLSSTLKLKVGQDDVWYVKNKTGSSIAKGTAVYASGTLGASSKILITPMIADGTIAAKFFLGIVAETIANEAEGYVLTKGKLRNINTNAYNEGDVLWVSPTIAGALTSTEPTAPDLKLPVAFVVNKGNNGVLAVRATTGQRIKDASDVNYAGTVDNSFLVYDLASGVWVDEAVGIFKTIAVDTQTSIVADSYEDTLTIAAGTGISLTTDASTDTLTITNSLPDQVVSLIGGGTTTITSAYPTFTITSNDEFDGTVTSVAALTLGTAGTDLSSTVVNSTTTPVITLNVPTASATNRGALSFTDWTTFNGKQDALAFTAPLLNTSGTITITQSDATTDGYLSSTDWIAFNGKQNAIILTTTGTSGAATLTGATLNIPQYTDQYTGTVTSVAALTLGTAGTDLTSTVVNSTTTPVITLNVPTASATNRGALSFTDWTTFNDKQNAITLTTTGTSGAATLAGATLNIPQYTDQYVGTVTSVAALTLGTTGTDLSSTVANGTTTPVITLNVPTASAANRGALSSTDWTTFNGKASNSFTTIAVSGQISIVADTATDTLTLAAGTGISLTTNDATDTLTITNTAATNIACFAAYSTQNLSLTATGTEYPIEFNVESITNASFFTHSTTVDPEEITVLVAGKYEISMGYVASNGNSTIATVQGYVGINGVGVPSFSFLQLNTSTVGQYASTGFNTYIYDLDANDVITAIFFPTYVAASTGTITINPSGYDGSTYITIKKIG